MLSLVEGGLIVRPEKLIMDCEMLQMIQRYMEPAVWDASLTPSLLMPLMRLGHQVISLVFSTPRIVIRLPLCAICK